VVLTAIPVGILLGLFYFVHTRLKLESQLVDQWWRIHVSDIELVETWRKSTKDGSIVATGNSMVSSETRDSSERHATTVPPASVVLSSASSGGKQRLDATRPSSDLSRTEVTRTTADTTGVWGSSVADVCYGNIRLGIFRLAKVALKPINKFHQSRRLMIELRSVSSMVG
jgi:hypothetical protein